MLFGTSFLLLLGLYACFRGAKLGQYHLKINVELKLCYLYVGGNSTINSGCRVLYYRTPHKKCSGCLMLPLDSPHGHKQLLTFYTTKFLRLHITLLLLLTQSILNLSNTLKTFSLPCPFRLSMLGFCCLIILFLVQI